MAELQQWAQMVLQKFFATDYLSSYFHGSHWPHCAVLALPYPCEKTEGTCEEFFIPAAPSTIFFTTSDPHSGREHRFRAPQGMGAATEERVPYPHLIPFTR